MKRLSTHRLKVSLVSLAVLNSLSLHAAENADEELEVIGVHYAKPITVAEPAETIIDWTQIEEQQYSNFAAMIDAVPGATLDGGARSGGERINIRGFDDPSDIAVFVDGAPIGFQQYRYGTFFFDPFLIGEAKIIKGAHDYRALNGKFGGSIRIKPKALMTCSRAIATSAFEHQRVITIMAMRTRTHSPFMAKMMLASTS